MPRHHDLNAHLRNALHNSVKIVHFKPQQDPVTVWLIFTITNRAMVVFNSEPVQLKNELAIRD